MFLCIFLIFCFLSVSVGLNCNFDSGTLQITSVNDFPKTLLKLSFARLRSSFAATASAPFRGFSGIGILILSEERGVVGVLTSGTESDGVCCVGVEI